MCRRAAVQCITRNSAHYLIGHHGEGLRVFNRMGLSVPTDAKYTERARADMPASTWLKTLRQ
jgi:hypothetical protein